MAINLLAGLAAGGGGGLNPFVGLTAAIQPFQAAMGATTGQFQQLSGVLTPFVSAIQPAVVAAVGRAFRDLNAVIGVALVPVMEALIPIVRGFADALYPVTQALAPILRELSDTVGQALQPVFDAMTEVLLALMPTFKFLTEVVGNLFTWFANLVSIAGELFAAIMPLVDLLMGPFRVALTFVSQILKDWSSFLRVAAAVVGEVIKAFTEFLTGIFGGTTDKLKDTLTSLREAFQNVLKNVVLFTAALFKMIGFTSGFNAIIRAIEGRQRQSTVGLANATNPQLQAVEAIGKKLFTSAFIATAGAGKTPATEKDFLKEILGQLTEMQTGETWIDQLVNKFITELVKYLPKPPTPEQIYSAAQIATNPAGWLAKQVIG